MFAAIYSLLFLHDKLTDTRYIYNKINLVRPIHFTKFPETTISRANSEVQGKTDRRDSKIGGRIAKSERQAIEDESGLRRSYQNIDHRAMECWRKVSHEERRS